MSELHEGHRERLRKSFLKGGLDPMEPHNVLELILTFSIPRKDTNELAHRLIREFGSFDRVLEADFERLREVDGVGEKTATHLKLILQSYRYYEQQKNRRAFYASSAEDAVNYARSLFVGEMRELSYLMCFDANMKLSNCTRVSEGSINATTVSIRRILEIATANKASTVILAHNHPGGLATPSAEDISTTKRILSGLHLIGVDLADHIIVCDSHAVSMAQTSVLFNLRSELGI